MQALLLAGGKGTRLWPISHANTPKQILSPLGGLSLLEITIERIKQLKIPLKNIHLVTSAQQVPILKPFWDDLLGSIIAEPDARNTAPAILLAVKYLQSQGIHEKESIFIFPSDHYIENFHPNITHDLSDMILCYRIIPTRIETGYGYIQTHTGGTLQKVRQFTEKPNLETASKWWQNWSNPDLSSNEKFYWNSGIYAFSIHSLSSALEKINPELHSFWKNASYEDFLQNYQRLEKLPFDKLIAEHAYNLYSEELPADSWRDIGTWESVYDAFSKTPEDNVAIGESTVITSDSTGCLAFSKDKNFNIAFAGVKDIAVIKHENTILIIDKKNPDAMKHLLENLEENHRDLL